MAEEELASLREGDSLPDVDSLQVPIRDAIQFAQEGNLLKAEQTIDTVLSTNPNHCAALNAKGTILLRRKKYEQASLWFDRALLSNPSENERAIIMNNKTTSEGSKMHKWFINVTTADNGCCCCCCPPCFKDMFLVLLTIYMVVSLFFVIVNVANYQPKLCVWWARSWTLSDLVETGAFFAQYIAKFGTQ